MDILKPADIAYIYAIFRTLMIYKTLTPATLATEHLCCAMADKKSASAVEAKKQWLADRMAEGLVFRKGDIRGKVFIEYLPADVAWVPVIAPGWMYINCLWVSGSYKNQGFGNELLDYCRADALQKGMKGLVTLSSAKKRPFLSDKSFLTKHGFSTVDRAEPWFELLALPLDPDATNPVFAPSVRKPATTIKGTDIWFTPQCPFAVSYSSILYDWALANGHELRLHQIASWHEAQNHACPYTTFSLFIDGRFITHEIPTTAKLGAMIAKR